MARESCTRALVCLSRPCQLAWCILALSSCTGPDGGNAEGEEVEEVSPDLVLAVSIGEREVTRPEYQFAEIGTIVLGVDGSIWVADGGGARGVPGYTAQVRRFDSGGAFLGRVGSPGPGPGEYRSPEGLARLPDGRIALRDLAQPDRITFFTPEGMLDSVLRLGRGYAWRSGAGQALQADTAGALWLPSSGRPGPDGSLTLFARVEPNGTIVDSIPVPVLEGIDRTYVEVRRRTPAGSVTTRRFPLPYQPRRFWRWSPLGEFAVGRTDTYRVEMRTPRTAADSADRTREHPGWTTRLVVERDVTPAPLTRTERAEAHSRLMDEISAFDPRARARIADIPTHKQIIRSIHFSDEGDLWVSVFLASDLEVDGGIEPLVYDIFNSAGAFKRRLQMPGSFNIQGVHGNRIWGVYRDRLGVESVRIYQMQP